MRNTFVLHVIHPDYSTLFQWFKLTNAYLCSIFCLAIHPSKLLASCHFLTVLDNGAMNLVVPNLFKTAFSSSGYVSRYEIATSYNLSVFHFNLTILLSHKQCTGISVSPYLACYFLVFILITASPMVTMSYLKCLLTFFGRIFGSELELLLYAVTAEIFGSELELVFSSFRLLENIFP